MTSSTWSYNPSGSGHGGFGGGSKLSKNPWPDSIVPPSDLWDNSLGVKGGRVAPPGLKTAGKLDANGWNAGPTGPTGAGGGGWNNSSAAWTSTWILLKNLTAQVTFAMVLVVHVLNELFVPPPFCRLTVQRYAHCACSTARCWRSTCTSTTESHCASTRPVMRPPRPSWR